MLWVMLLMLQQEVYNSNLDFTFCLHSHRREISLSSHVFPAYGTAPMSDLYIPLYP